MCISGLDGHIANSGCPSLSQWPEESFFQLVVVKDSRFAVGISISCVTVANILAFPVSAAMFSGTGSGST